MIALWIVLGITLIIVISVTLWLLLRKTKFTCAGMKCVKDSKGIFNNLKDCQANCKGKYVCRNNSCFLTSPTQTDQVYNSLQDCESDCRASQACYYWGGTECSYENPCSHTPNYSTQQACVDAHPSTGCYCWDGSKCYFDDKCTCSIHYSREADCQSAHPQTTQWYSWNQYQNCVENQDCEETSDRNFCVKGHADCAGAPFFNHTKYDIETIIARLQGPTKLIIAPKPTNQKAGLPFDTIKLPVLTYDHECHMSVNSIGTSGEYGITVQYGIACDHHTTINCATDFDSECKYGGQFWTTPIINSDEALITYDIHIPKGGFKAVDGGKLPGVYGMGPGGNISDKTCSHCTGSHPSDGARCWSARPMWRAGFFGEVLLVVPVKTNTCSGTLTADEANAGSIKNPDGSTVLCTASWGCDLARGSFRWPIDKEGTVKVAIYVKMNTAGKKDGLFYFFIQKDVETKPTLIFYYSDILYRVIPQLQISGILFSTFFGGGSPERYQPREQLSLTFSNFNFYKT